MDTVMEDEVYSWRQVKVSTPEPEPELERETGERRRGRDILVAVDHGPKSKYAFDWALIHFCRLADTLHLVHAVSNVKNEIVYGASKSLVEKLAVEAYEVALVRTTARIVEGEAGKVICREADRVKPAAVVMGTRGRGLIQSVIRGSVSEHCFHNCKSAPVIIVPGKGAGNELIFQASEGLIEKLAIQAVKVAKVRTEARILEGEAGKMICKEADRLKPAAVVMGNRGRTLIQSVLKGSVSEYCLHHCKSAPLVVVPGN